MTVSRFVFEIVTTSFFTTSETIILAALSAVYTTSSTGFLLRSMVATVVKRTVLSWYRVRDRRTDNSFASFSLCWQLVYKGGDSCLLTQHVYAVAYTGRRKLRWECPTCDCGDYKHKKYTESKTSFFYCVRHRCTNASQSALFNVTIETIQPERNRKTPPSTNVTHISLLHRNTQMLGKQWCSCGWGVGFIRFNKPPGHLPRLS